MLQGEHSAILLAFIKLSLISLFCLFLSGPFTQVLLTVNFRRKLDRKINQTINKKVIGVSIL